MAKIDQIYPQEHESWLPSHALLWRYIPLKTLLFHLTENIFIPSIEMLRREDPFEGKFLFQTVWFNTAMRDCHGNELVDKLDEWLKNEFCSDSEKRDMKLNQNYPDHNAGILENHYFDYLRKTRYAWCWFLSGSESAAMWNNYGKQGVAVATTVGKLCDVLKQSDRDFSFGQMRYLKVLGGQVRGYDFSPENGEDAQFLLRPYFLKRKEYESESEVRFVTAGPERADQGGIILNKINPRDWIQEIRLWPGLKATEEASLQQVVANLVPEIPCKCSDLFGVDPSALGDFIPTILGHLDDWNWAKWKDGSDNIPSEMKQP